jgi:molybdopterin-containing oxidoreductase family molybdopterin binding subunit
MNNIKEDVWIPSSCNICYGGCSILAHRVNGVLTKIEGNPESPIGMGRLCPKGVSGIMILYDPNRVNVPLKRTNPEKGFGVDPKWVEITWDEALDTIVERLKKIREDDPRKLFFMGTTTCGNTMTSGGVTFISAFGSHNFLVGGGGLHCGNGAHLLNGVMHASWSLVPDFEYSNYIIYFGASKGHAAGHAANSNAQKAADARARGAKFVVVDPMCNFSASKSVEWIPIKPGTDGAFAIAIINILLNELNIYDREYIKKHTNGPYLIRPDGYYMRDENGTPLIWDPVDNRAKPYNDLSIKDLSIKGEYEISGTICKPGFQLLKEHVRKYTPEEVSRITTIPPDTIRRIAKEFGEAARVGSKIVIEGVELPYRPACAIYFRGAQGHKNSTLTCMAIELLNQVVGAADVPGGALGFTPVSYGHPDTGRPYFVPKEGEDGIMLTGTWMVPHLPYPPNEPRVPESIGLGELFPLGMLTPLTVSSDQEELWEKVGLPYRVEMIINFGSNPIMSVGNPGIVAESIKRIPFIVSFDIFLTEFSQFADIVLPDGCYLERFDPGPAYPPILNHPAGMGEWGWPIRQSVVEPAFKRRNFTEVMLEIADRIGMRDDFYAVLNLFYELKGPYKLDSKREYTWEEICNNILKNNFGEEHDINWFRKNGIIKWKKRVEEVYWRPFLNVRVPIYFEYIRRVGDKVKEIADKLDIKLDYSYYQPLPDYRPCVSHQVADENYDLYGFYYRDVLHTNSFTMENPWLDEASLMNQHTYYISINLDTGRKKGIKDGDTILVESTKGRRIKGKVKLIEGIHPECLGIAACSGHWSPNMPVAKGKGVLFNELLEVDLEHSDPANLNMDLCVKVRIYKEG